MRTPTDSQWAAIRASTRHTLVAAGAGTGKTSTVVGHILHLLGIEIRGERRHVPLELHDIGAITYTNAAAADLKRKLREELRAHGRRDLAHDVDGARIGTIHSFCGDVLREFALRTGRAPGLRILEEGEAVTIAAEAVRETILDVLEDRSVEGLDPLFAVWPVSEVEDWVGRLASDGGRLDRIVAVREELGGAERTIVDLAAAARANVERRLEAINAVDFDRMIVWTRDLLARDAYARRQLQRRLRVLIVDEFQDVDPLQKEIAYLLGDPASGRTDTTRLMLVGDPKQSIYRFRRADVTLWREVQRDFETGGLGDVVTLADNFRSVPAVLGFVDATVGAILDEPIDTGGEGTQLRDFEVPYQPVAAARTSVAADAIDPAVELTIVVPADDEKLSSDDVRAAEAGAIARRTLELRDEGFAWRDMALLLPSWRSLGRYEMALRRAGVKTYALRGEGFYDRREVLDLILALETLRDPRDDRALLGLLRSPFVGLRDDTLLAIAWQSEPPYWDALDRVQVDEQPRLDRALALLHEHVALRDRMPADRLLESFLERSGYVAHLRLLGPDADQAIANVRKFLRLARQSAGESVGSLLSAIAERRARGDREGDERLYGVGEDVFTITSIHSAKGLEWPVVFWGDMVGVPQRFSGHFLVGRDRVALKDPDLDSASQPLHWQRLLQDEEAEQAAERKRLWYVAATRARDRLIVSGLHPSKGDGKSTGAALFRALGVSEAAELGRLDGDRLPYQDRAGHRFECIVRVAPADAQVTSSGPETAKA